VNDEDEWHLPHDYWVEYQANGRFVLFRDDRSVHHFPIYTEKRAVVAWCDAYETGRRAGLRDGLTLGRGALAGELRALLQLP
jgi:hypothetical protein